MSDLPRSILLALWANAVLAGRATAGAGADVVTGDDERHLLDGDDLPFSGHPDGPGLADWLDSLADRPLRGCRAILPVPGDLGGVPAGSDLVAAAMSAGEAVLTSGEPGEPAWLLVPDVEEFGSPWERGVRVTWRSRRLEAQPATWLDPADAEQGLQRVLLEVTSALEDLDIAAVAPQQLAGLTGVRAGTSLAVLPPGTTGRTARLIGRAVTLGRIAELADGDDGAAVTAWQREKRRKLLQELTSRVRLALMAATVPEALQR